VLQELLQGFSGPKNRDQILDRFSAVPLLVPDRDDHVRAAELKNHCRRNGVQVGTIDALLAHLCIRHDLTMLTADTDFRRIADHSKLKLWNGG
jgi:predicted nucleic acid-binding protein